MANRINRNIEWLVEDDASFVGYRLRPGVDIQIPTLQNGALFDAAGNRLPIPVEQVTWAARPSAVTRGVGAQIIITDIGGVGARSVFYSTGTVWKPLGGSVVIANAAPTAASVTGAIVETEVARIQIPAGLMGLNDSIEIFHTWNLTNNANAKGYSIRFGGTSGLAGALYFNGSTVSNVVARSRSNIFAQGATDSQSSNFSTSFNTDSSGSAAVTSANDMTAQHDIVFTASAASAADVVSLRNYRIVLHAGFP